ncbi:MAG: DUF1190 domain-containing protein [Rhizobiales bacterium]|nr:DUF1190 domain-containing protein [Hyphomicrobiales bacterium]
MKRSSMIFLGATGILVAGAWLGRSTGPLGHDEKANIYDDVNACITAQVLTRDQCEAEFAAARERHLAEAPRFSSASTCETQYGSGQCQPATIAGTSYFLPVMAGILAGQMLVNRRPAQALLPPLRTQQPCAPGFTPATQPGCLVQRSSSTSSGVGGWRSYSTSSGGAISRNTSGPTTVTVPRGTVTTRSTTGSSTGSASSSGISRGGFGSTARSTSASSSS